MAITAPADIKAVPDQACAVGEPVTAEIAQDLAQAVNHLYEGLRDKATPGAASQIVPGHQHTGAGDGHSIPRIVFSQTFSIPLWANGDSPTPVKYDFGDGGEGGTQEWISASALSNVHNTRGWLQGTTGTAVSTTLPNMLVACAFRLREGCKGVKVMMWRGLAWGSAGTYATEVTWQVELRNLVTGTTAGTTIYDRAAYTSTEADGNENAQWVELPGVQPDASTENGEQSLTTYLNADETTGRLAADGDRVLYIGFTPNQNAGTGDTALYLYAVMVYEVMAE